MPDKAPSIITARSGGDDELLRYGTPQYDNGVRAAVVHHNAVSNDYSPLESTDIGKADRKSVV